MCSYLSVLFCHMLLCGQWTISETYPSGVTAGGFPALPTTLSTCRKRRYLNTSLCYLWCASDGVSPYYLLHQVVRVVGSAGDPSAVTPEDGIPEGQ